MKDKFYNRDGSLTPYSFRCGYMEKTEKGLSLWVELYFEGGVYHVRLFDTNAAGYCFKRFNTGSDCGRFWLSFHKLTDARKLYKKLARCIECDQDYSNVLSDFMGVKIV